MDNYKENKREKETVTVSFERYKVNGLPTCLSWVGSELHEPEICKFLLSKRFGTSYICGLAGEEIHTYKNTTLFKPCRECILWEETEQ